MLLVDETDKADVEVEGLLLEVLSDFQVTIPELGTVARSRRPFVVLTSNATRELSEALQATLPVPAPRLPGRRAREGDRAGPRPGAARAAGRVAGRARCGRCAALELKKPPSIAETIDWAHTLLALGLRRPGRARRSPARSASCSSTPPTP